MTIASEEYMYPDDHVTAYHCATCGTQGIRVKSVVGQPWVVSCANGHPWVLSPYHDIEFTMRPGYEDVAELTVNRTSTQQGEDS